ncbi:MAG TPA: DinB family protein [Candidatus Acidoferrum sp.]|nr:DinB family protein [Candidatus Acidoferrum sp.]
MKKLLLLLTALVLLLASQGKAASANPASQPGANASSEDKTPPSYDMKPQALLDLQGVHKKMVELATAIPAEKYTWRPEAGVRSVSELFLHVTAANYNIPGMISGTAPMPAFKAEGFETSTTDKAKIIDQLNQSFAYAEAAIQSMTNADFAKPEKKLGPDANDGDVIYILVTHNHEHLGQSIAYARLNGVTPPWTEEAQKKAKAAKDASAPK